MANTEVPLLYNKYRFRALQNALEIRGVSVEQELKNKLDSLYRQYVPAGEQEIIEAKIQKEEAVTYNRSKAFGVFHLHGEDGDVHIASRQINNLLQFGKLYIDQLRSKADTFTIDSLACLFGEHRDLDAPWFRSICDTFNSNESVHMIADVDFERGYISAIEGVDEEWLTYRLGDIAAAASAAYEPSDLSDFERWEVFSAELNGKAVDESVSPTEDAGTSLQL